MNLNRENGDWCCEWLDDLRHTHRFLHDVRCFYALQETDSRTTSAMNVPGYIVCGRDHGRTAILCPRDVNHFRRSWVDHERCTAILVGSSMLLSVCLPHSGRDEVDDIETVRNVMTEGRMAGAVDFYIGGDINVDVRLGDADEDLQGLDSIVWYGMYAPECKGGGEDVITYGKMRLLQLLKEFLCTVTSTWTNNDDKCEHRTWRAWGSRVRRKQFHCVMGPRDLRSTTWFLDYVRLRIWDRFLVVVKKSRGRTCVRRRE